MSSIFVEMGQCGCQIGHKLNNKLSNSYYSSRIFQPNKIHAIMIDTQPKVLKPLINNPPSWLDVGNVKYFQHGRGNNWSYGYMHQLPQRVVVSEFVEGHRQFSHLTNRERGERQSENSGPINEIRSERQNSAGKSFLEKQSLLKQKQQLKSKTMKRNKQQSLKFLSGASQVQKHPSFTQFQEKVLIQKYLKQNKQICQFILNRIRKQLDYSDCPSAINVLCSLGGGTGSGLGTKILQKIYEQFNMDIFAHVILPNKSGQTPLQIYNCTLSLSSIQENCTGIFTYENDKMINSFLSAQNNDSGEPISFKGTDLDCINEQISEIQSRFFKINDLPSYDKFYNHIADQCIVSNQLKYLQLFGSTISNTKHNGDIIQIFDNCFEILCQQLRIYNEEMYQIEGVVTKREKCLTNNMVILAESRYIGSNVEIMEEKHRKKLRNIINPVEYNSQLNIEYAALPKSVKQTTNWNMKMSKMSAAVSPFQSPPCQISFVMNHSNIIRYLEYLTVYGKKKYQAKAYLWHYKYADLETAFENIEKTIDQYYYASQP